MSVIAERPHDSAYDFDLGWVWKVYTNIGTASARCWNLSNLETKGDDVWPAFQVAGVTEGPSHNALIYTGADGAWAYPDGAWAIVGNWFFRREHHNACDPLRRAVWTAPADWDNVALLSFPGDAYDANTTLALTGDGTLLEASVDSREAGNWAGSYLQDLKWLLVATGVSTGDTLTVSPTAGSHLRMAGVLCWNNATAEITAANGAMVLDPYRLRDAQLDAGIRHWGRKNEEYGHTLALGVQDKDNLGGAWWGSDAHCTATHRIENYTTTWYYKPAGAEEVWAPDPGGRVAGEYIKVVTAADVRMFDNVVGTWLQTLTFRDSGTTMEWAITWNALAATQEIKVTGGYNGMLNQGTGMGFFDHPSIQGNTTLVVAEGFCTSRVSADETRIWGTSHRGRCLAMTHVPTTWSAGTRARICRSVAGYKWYNELTAYDESEGGTLYDAVNTEVSDAEYHFAVVTRSEAAKAVAREFAPPSRDGVSGYKF